MNPMNPVVRRGKLSIRRAAGDGLPKVAGTLRVPFASRATAHGVCLLLSSTVFPAARLTGMCPITVIDVRIARRQISSVEICRWSFLLGAIFGLAAIATADEKIPRIAVITTVWYHNSHADVIAGRLLEGMTLEGRDFPQLKLASLYVDQFPANDKSRALSAKHGFPLYETVAKALTLGGDRLAVDGVMVIAEHGKYPESETGQIQFPKRRFLSEVFRVFETSGRVVPVFSDKHLSDNWTDVAWIWGEAKRL